MINQLTNVREETTGKVLIIRQPRSQNKIRNFPGLINLWVLKLITFELKGAFVPNFKNHTSLATTRDVPSYYSKPDSSVEGSVPFNLLSYLVKYTEATVIGF